MHIIVRVYPTGIKENNYILLEKCKSKIALIVLCM